MRLKSRLPTTTARNDELLYVYCAVHGRPAEGVLARQAGMPEGGPPRLVNLSDDITLVVSDVPLSTYNADAVERRLTDLDWVSHAGAAHHAVIDALAESHIVLPFRLFTLFSNEHNARATLQKTRSTIVKSLDRLRGKQEWVLRVTRPDASLASETPPPPAKSASGTGFLQAKANAKRAEVERANRVKQGVSDVFDALRALADEATMRPPQAGEPFLIDAAFLVESTRLDTFRETLTRVAGGLLRDGCRVSLTGPWPPYSFASLDHDANG